MSTSFCPKCGMLFSEPPGFGGRCAHGSGDVDAIEFVVTVANHPGQATLGEDPAFEPNRTHTRENF